MSSEEKEAASTDKKILLRLKPKMYEVLKKLADEDLRSINAEIEFALKEWLASRTSTTTNNINSQSSATDVVK